MKAAAERRSVSTPAGACLTKRQFEVIISVGYRYCVEARACEKPRGPAKPVWQIFRIVFKG
jgi:hypothetical protein